MTETLCIQADIDLKAGTNVSSAITAGQYTLMINDSEAYIMGLTRIDWVTLYSGLDATLKLILRDACSARSARVAINFDMSVYTSRSEAQKMLDVNQTIFDECMRVIKEEFASDFIRGT